ncbi:unnamed protein product [Discula destructiva]
MLTRTWRRTSPSTLLRLILELKCENQNMQGMKAKVQAEVDKLKQPLDPKYNKYDRAAFAMAYTPKAQNDLQALGMTALGGGVALSGDHQGNTLKVFRMED